MITYITFEVLLIAGIMLILNLLFVPLGCVVLWQKQTYFCEGVAHGCFLAVAISAITGAPIVVTVLCVSMLLAFLLHYTQRVNRDAVTSTHVIAHGMVALSVIIFQLVSAKYPININSLFFGDILSIDFNDFVIITILAVIITSVVYLFLNKFILVSFNHDLAFSQGVNPFKIELLLLFMLSLVAAFSLKIVGTLLIASLITITPAIARLFSKTPRQMIVLSLIIGISISFISLLGAIIMDVPPAALTTALQAIVFLLATILRNKINAK